MNTVVSKAGDGDFSTINEAIVAATPGATIQIQAGVYEECLIITKPLSLIGDPNGMVVVHHRDFTAIKIENTQVKLQDLAVGIGTKPFLFTSGSSVEIRGCAVGPVEKFITASEPSLNKYISVSLDRVRSNLSPQDGNAAELTSALDESNNVGLFTANSSISTFNSVFNRTRLTFENSQANVNDSGFESSAIYSRGGGGTISKSFFRSILPQDSVLNCDDSNMVVNSTSIVGKASVGIHSSKGSIKVENCTLEGIGEKGTGILAFRETQVAINECTVARYDQGISVGGNFCEGKVEITKSRLINNGVGCNIFVKRCLDGLMIELADCAISNNKTGCCVNPPTTRLKENNLWFKASACKIENNGKCGIEICFPCHGLIRDSTFNQNGRDLYRGLALFFPLLPFRRRIEIVNCSISKR